MLALDIGSNTLRAIEVDEGFKKKREFEFIIAAAQGLNESGNIGQAAILRLREALGNLSKEYDLSKARAVATAAFRKAKNTKELFEALRAEFGIKILCIDAILEARLSVLGMRSGLKRLGLSGVFAFCDLGGASCEFAFDKSFKSFEFGIISFYEWVKNKTLTHSNSIPIPSFKRWDKKLKICSLSPDKSFKILAFSAFEVVSPLKRELKKHGVKRVVLNSGVPTTLCAFKQGISYANYRSEMVNGKRLYAGEFLRFAWNLWRMSESEAAFWVGSMRKPYFVAGCLLLFALFEREELIVIDEGLREGVAAMSEAEWGRVRCFVQR